MKKHWNIIRLVFVATLILGILIFFGRSRFEPSDQGRILTSWLDDLRLNPKSPDSAAAIAIRHMGTNAVPFLIDMLHAKDSSFRKQCMGWLSLHSWIKIHFRTDLEKHDDALRGLAVLGPDATSAIPSVAAFLEKNEVFISIRTGSNSIQVPVFESGLAAFTLVQIGSNSVPALERTLTGTNSLARVYAAGALGALHVPSSATNLIAALRNSDARTRHSVVLALGCFPEQADVVVPVLMDRLDDPVLGAAAAYALGQVGLKAKPAVPKLLKMSVSTKANFNEAAIMALMKIDRDAILAALTNDLASADVNMRRNSAWALYQIKSAGAPAVPCLIGCLKDPDAKVRRNAVLALREIGSEPDAVMPALIQNLDDPDNDVRVAAAVTLGRFGRQAKAAVPSIEKIIQENQSNDFTSWPLHDALAAIDPAAAARFSRK